MHSQVLTFARQAHAACALTDEFFNRLAGRVEIATEINDSMPEVEQIRLSTLRGYFYRTQAWLGSATKLDSPADLQAVTVGARSLFEAAVDLVLLQYAASEHPIEKILWWERSAKLKHAERVVRFFNGRPIPYEHQVFETLLAGPEPSQIRAARLRWWANKHPPRWTGRDLAQDAQRADAVYPSAQLREFYEIDFGPTCWNTHGSGMAGLRASDPILVPGMYGAALTHADGFALLVARLVLEALGLFLEVEFEDFQRDARLRVEAIAADVPDRSERISAEEGMP